MCHNIITACIKCSMFIDSVLQPCKEHTSISIDQNKDDSLGYCPVRHSLDGYALNPSIGMPFNPDDLLVIPGGYHRHPLWELRSLCVWCRSKISDNDFSIANRSKRSKRYEAYEDCGEMTKIRVHADGSILRDEKPFASWKMRHTGEYKPPRRFGIALNTDSFAGQGNYSAFLRVDEPGSEQFDLKAVQGGASREPPIEFPSRLLTAAHDFTFNEETVYKGPPTITLQEARLERLRVCPLQKQLDLYAATREVRQLQPHFSQTSTHPATNTFGVDRPMIPAPESQGLPIFQSYDDAAAFVSPNDSGYMSMPSTPRTPVSNNSGEQVYQPLFDDAQIAAADPSTYAGPSDVQEAADASQLIAFLNDDFDPSQFPYTPDSEMMDFDAFN